MRGELGEVRYTSKYRHQFGREHGGCIFYSLCCYCIINGVSIGGSVIDFRSVREAHDGVWILLN